MRWVAAVAILLVAACEGGRLTEGEALAGRAGGGPGGEIRVLSTRADLVSGGNALVEIVMPSGTKVAELTVEVGGRDVSAAFARRVSGRVVGLVTGLGEGPNELVARFGNGTGHRLTLTNHPLGGPVFSGPQIQPWTCDEGANDLKCNREPDYSYQYMSTSGSFADYDPDNPPDDVAMTTTDEGHTVPYIVRVERGVIDRDNYAIAVLYDPQSDWTPWQPQEAFNHKLVINHGASCNTEYQQASPPDVMLDVALSRGFVVMSHALNNSGHNCNIAVQAEAMIMTKEHLVESYGELRYTIGTGCSGGAQVQQQVANAYPGFYQGITPACSFPDSWSGKMLYEDYSLLRAYFEDPSRWSPGVVWGYDHMAAVMGHPSYVNAITYNTVIATLLDPSRSCPGVADEDVYDPDTNPDGVRCSQQDYMAAVFGRRPQDGFANRPWDNVGVQYGLLPLLEGAITVDQFLDVNARIGARDIDYNPIPERVSADIPALAAAYRSGAVNTGSNLDEVAIIDLRGPDPGAFHDVYRTYALRARLDREHGHHDNHVIWRGPVALFGGPDFADEAILAMDVWLAAVEADERDIPLPQKIVENKPPEARERCTDGRANGVEIPDLLCNEIVDSYSATRVEAGMPFTDDIMKCELKPLSEADYYPLVFTTEQWVRLEGIFPDGVCDWSKPGVEFQPTLEWPTFENGPGGEPLGPPPRSQPLNS